MVSSFRLNSAFELQPVKAHSKYSIQPDVYFKINLHLNTFPDFPPAPAKEKNREGMGVCVEGEMFEKKGNTFATLISLGNSELSRTTLIRFFLLRTTCSLIFVLIFAFTFA